MAKKKNHEMAMPMEHYEEPTLAERVARSLEYRVAERLADQLVDAAAAKEAAAVAAELGIERTIGGIRVLAPDGAATTHAAAKVPRGRRI